MNYSPTDFGANNSSRFPFTARKNGQTDRRDETPLPTPAAMPAWVTNKMQSEMADVAPSAATWRTVRNVRVVFDSSNSMHYCRWLRQADSGCATVGRPSVRPSVCLSNDGE